MHLGLFLCWMTRAVHYLIQIDIYDSRQSRKEDHLKSFAVSFHSQLSSWYPVYEKRASPTARKGITRINHFSEHMLGTADGISLLSLKAAESRHLLPFIMELVCFHSEKLQDVCNAEALINAGQRLMDWMSVITSEPRKMSASAVSSLVSLTYLHCKEAEQAGVRLKPKHRAAILLCFGISLSQHATFSADLFSNVFFRPILRPFRTAPQKFLSKPSSTK